MIEMGWGQGAPYVPGAVAHDELSSNLAPLVQCRSSARLDVPGAVAHDEPGSNLAPPVQCRSSARLDVPGAVAHDELALGLVEQVVGGLLPVPHVLEPRVPVRCKVSVCVCVCVCGGGGE